jgi:poly(3-hydroxybutyrate) depolymerase
MRKLCLVASALLQASAVLAQDLPRGQVIDEVKCAGDPAQSYALYLPSNYSRDRTWSLLVAFHPAARGRAMVDAYRAAAEKYGYIVAGSNTSRNGPWQVAIASLHAMSADFEQRVSIDANRVYLTGLSGGARVALQVALGSKQTIAGVIASSAGYPDNQRRKSLPFVLFGTAGTEDFNYIELRMLDRALTTPHRLAIFEGGHMLPPERVALDAIEWLELQAMKSGRKTRDEALIDQLFDTRQRAIVVSASPAATVHLLEDLAHDFAGLRDVSAATARASELSKQKDVKSALAREREDDDAEARQLDEVLTLEAGLRDESAHLATLGRLRDWLSRTARQANAAADSPVRRRARRALSAITMGAGDRVQDPDYLKLLQQYRQPGPGRLRV